jgi:hypothetical protein
MRAAEIARRRMPSGSAWPEQEGLLDASGGGGGARKALARKLR